MLSGCARKGFLALVLALAILPGALSGCTGQNDAPLSILIPTQGDNVRRFLTLFGEKYPDITFEPSAYRGGGASAYIAQRFEMGDLTDIVIATSAPTGEIQQATLLDLSGYDFVHSYKAGILSGLDVDGKIYLLEGPGSVRGIAYNKTLFEERGWKVPQSHEDFIALVAQIRSEGDVLPIAIPGKFSGTYFTLMSELSHCDFLQTPGGAQWEKRFAAGEASSQEGFATGIRLLQDWLDAGAFDPVQMDAGATFNYDLLAQRQCAMVYVIGSQSALVERLESSPDVFGMMPMYGYGEDSEFVATTQGIKLGINKKLGEPGNEKKLEKALKVLEFLSTEEGQMVFHTGRGDILPLAGTSSSLSPMFEEVNEVMNRGHAAPYLYAGYEDLLAEAGEYIRDVCYRGGSLTGVFDLMDGLRRESLASQESYIATVAQTLDQRQTAQFVANALHAQGFGDFALVSMGRYSPYFYAAGGANGKLYEGGISAMNVNLPLTDVAIKNVRTLTLTGAQVKQLLAAGRVLKDDEGHQDAFEYFGGGLKVERNRDGSLKSATLGGAPLEDEKVYTVAFSPEDYSDETAQAGDPQDTGVAWQDAYRSYIGGLGVITPEHAR